MKRFSCIIFLIMISTSHAWGQYVNPQNGVIYTAKNTKTAYGVIAFSGAALAADSAIVIMPDTTFAKTAKKIIWGSLLDPETCCNYAQFRELEKNTSWYNVSGPKPVAYENRINTGQDSLIITNRQTSDVWMVFAPGANNMITDATPVLVDVKELDNKIYLVGTGGAALTIIDFVSDKAYQYTTSGFYIYNGSISQRNAGNGWILLNAAPAIVNSTVNAVAVIRDPLGATEPGTGRPLARVAVATAGGLSVSDAGIANIYNSSSTRSMSGITSLPSGDLFNVVKGAAQDSVNWQNYLQTLAASFTPNGSFSNVGAGSGKLPFANAATETSIVAIPYASVANTSSPVVVIGSSVGVAVSHTNRGTTANGLTFTVDATRNSPLWSATADSLGWCFEKLSGTVVDTGNVWGKNLTRSGTGAGVTSGAGVIGQAAVLAGNANSVLKRVNDQSLRNGTGAFTVSLWAKSTSASNPGSNQLPYEAAKTHSNDSHFMYFNTSGYLVFAIDENGTDVTATFSQDIYDANWHFLVLTRNSNTLTGYVDGEQVVSTTGAITSSIDPDSLAIGDGIGAAAGEYFAGSVDQFQIIKRLLTASEIRWLYQQGLHGLQSAVDPHDALHSATVGYVSADPSGKWFAAGTTDSVTILDEYGIPKYRYGSPGGNIQTVALRSSPGADSLSIVIGTTTKTWWKQSDPRIADLAQNTRPTYPDHEGWAYHVTTPGDSGTWAEGGVTISAADSLARFSNATATNGILRVGKNAEIRGTLWVRTSTTPSADIAEMFATPSGNYRTGVKAISSDRTEFFAPAFLRPSSIVVTDNDSTRTYSVKVEKANDTDPARIFMDVARVGVKDSTTSKTVYVNGIEVGDSLRYRVDSTSVSVVVTVVKGDTVTLASAIPAKTAFRILPPGLLVKYTGSVIQAGDVVQMAAGKAMRLSTVVGKRGWIVSTSPGQILGTGREGVPVALVGTTPCAVSADSGAVSPGDPLTAGVNGVAVKAKRGRDDILGWAQESVALGVKSISVLVGP